jgi:hypothetical protein
VEEIVKQFVKNKQKNHYANRWLDVPEKYSYLKQNSMKQNRTGSRLKKALTSGVPVNVDVNVADAYGAAPSED